MNYNHLLANFQFDRQSLLDFGFAEKGDVMEYRVDLPNSLYVLVRLSPKKLDVEVFDAIFNDRYQPFVSGHGGGAIKGEVREILENILAKCSRKVDAQRQVCDFIRERFGVLPEYPWEDLPEYCTFKALRSQKWFGIIMHIPARLLNLEGDKIYIMDIKLPPNEVVELTDNVQYFPAYHMNKVHWVTVLLNSNTDFPRLWQLLETAYNLVEKH